MTEKEILKLINKRITAEFKKHPTLNWSILAAKKILSSLKYYNVLVVQPERLSEEDTNKECKYPGK